MQKAQTVMNAEASSIMLLNEDTNLLECRFALGKVQEKVKNKMQLKVGQGIAGWVAENGEPVIVQDVNNDSRFYQNVDKATGFITRSILAAPLKVKGKVIGVAEVINRCDGNPFTEDNLNIFSTFCRQVALAIENAKVHQLMLKEQRLKQELESAHIIQQSFMPQAFPQSPDNQFQVFGKNIPAISVGGDLFDFVEFNSHQLGLVIGDVSGKGIPAALYMAQLVSDLRYISHLKHDAVHVLTTLNELLFERSRRGMFVTLQYFILDNLSGQLTIVNGGHLPPIWIHNENNTFSWIRCPEGIPLGIMPDFSFEKSIIKLRPGDYIVMFTDGVIEAKNRRGDLFTKERLGNLVANQWKSPENLVKVIIDSILNFSRGTSQHDDITVLALKWK
jgi:sigma-B regulation protein RsbU (phosphoserine phosphatase)